jgi:hypothetical protein
MEIVGRTTCIAVLALFEILLPLTIRMDLPWNQRMTPQYELSRNEIDPIVLGIFEAQKTSPRVRNNKGNRNYD